MELGSDRCLLQTMGRQSHRTLTFKGLRLTASVCMARSWASVRPRVSWRPGCSAASSGWRRRRGALPRARMPPGAGSTTSLRRSAASKLL